MAQYRLSKYSPTLRDDNGAFLGDDWTSVSDIGRSFDGRPLTVEQYASVKDAFVSTLLSAHRWAGEPLLFAESIEARAEPTILGGRRSAGVTAQGSPAGATDLAPTIRGGLREEFWCKLTSHDRRFWIHFGHDFYVYLGVDAEPNQLLVDGRLFLEPFRSPYLSDPDAVQD